MDDLGLEADAVLGRLIEFHRPDRLIVAVLPQKAQRIGEFHTHRIDNIAHPVRRGRRGDAANDAPFFIDRLHLKDGIGPVLHWVSPRLP